MVTLRTLTLKSTMGFGLYRFATVQQLLDEQPTYLLWAYYHCSSISFHQDILKQLVIGQEYQIVKPGTNPELFHKLCSDYNISRYTEPIKPNNKTRHHKRARASIHPDNIIQRSVDGKTIVLRQGNASKSSPTHKRHGSKGRLKNRFAKNKRT